MRYSAHFTVEELQCPTAKEIKLQDGFIDDLEDLRIEYGRPMAVNSGGRSKEHNDWLISIGEPASPNSLHLIDNKKYGTDTIAVDIKRPGIVDLADLIEIALKRGWTVRVANSFVHLDMRSKYTKLPRHFDTYR